MEITPRKVEGVYNFTTETENYLLSKGVVVHNCDTISMLSVMNLWKPTAYVDFRPSKNDSSIWEMDIEEDSQSGMSSYVV